MSTCMFLYEQKAGERSGSVSALWQNETEMVGDCATCKDRHSHQEDTHEHKHTEGQNISENNCCFG